MIVRKRRRIEVRLDEERGEFLDGELARRGMTAADWFREQVDAQREREARERRLAAVRRLASMNLDMPTDPAELKHLLNEAHCPGPEFCDCHEPDEEFLALLDRLQAEPITLPSWDVLKRELEEAHCPFVGECAPVVTLP